MHTATHSLNRKGLLSGPPRFLSSGSVRAVGSFTLGHLAGLAFGSFPFGRSAGFFFSASRSLG
jgi:hypothetical protein